MNINQLIDDTELDIDISSIAFDTRNINNDCLFFCLMGKENDGHTFAEEAVAKGAVALVVEHKLAINIPQIEVEDCRHALSIAASRYYGNPSKSLKMIGITGTNGKTTTSYIVKSILDSYGVKTGLIGTTAILLGDKRTEAKLTTPDPIDLHATLKEMVDNGVEYVVMEVSAHALELKKVDGIMFDVAAFTNISQDHLDYFETMDKYIATKKSFFTSQHARFGVINSDDGVGAKLAKETLLPSFSYGYQNPCDVFAIDLKMSVDGLEYILNLNDDLIDVKFNLTGRFNMYNTLCAAAIARALDIPLKDISRGIRTLKKVEGRFNIVNTSKCSIIIDFAHTDDGLRNILASIKEFAVGKIITVFGCGGNRDRVKRPIMGKVVAELSDYCVLTSDNPRFENPLDIIREIEEGVNSLHRDNYCIVEDRKSAIRHALEIAKKDDIVLIAGKGAEKYQDIMGIKQPYNDEKYVMEIAREFEL